MLGLWWTLFKFLRSYVKKFSFKTIHSIPMFGLVVMDGREWNKLVNIYVSLFGFVKVQWNMMELIPFYTIQSSHFSFIPIWSVCNGMNNIQTMECNLCSIPLPLYYILLCFIPFHQFEQSLKVKILFIFNIKLLKS
jgi:hypothetical protein